jgi:hypothetical protein
LTTMPVSATLRAVGFGNSLAHALRGAEIVSTFSDLEHFSFGFTASEEAALRSRLTQVYNQTPDVFRGRTVRIPMTLDGPC